MITGDSTQQWHILPKDVKVLIDPTARHERTQTASAHEEDGA